MQVTVFGATGSIGRAVVERAIGEGYGVRAFVRDASAQLPSNAVAIVGELTDEERVSRAVSGSDAVIWAVGAARNTPDQVELFAAAARTLVAAMRRNDVRRLIALSGAGITVDGERKPLAGRVMSSLVRIAVPHVVASKRAEYEIFKASGLDWTLVRPPRVNDAPPSGGYLVGDRLGGRSVTTGDVAEFMVGQVSDTTFVGRAPYISSRTKARGDPRTD